MGLFKEVIKSLTDFKFKRKLQFQKYNIKNLFTSKTYFRLKTRFKGSHHFTKIFSIQIF